MSRNHGHSAPAVLLTIVTLLFMVTWGQDPHIDQNTPAQRATARRTGLPTECSANRMRRSAPAGPLGYIAAVSTVDEIAGCLGRSVYPSGVEDSIRSPALTVLSTSASEVVMESTLASRPQGLPLLRIALEWWSNGRTL